MERTHRASTHIVRVDEVIRGELGIDGRVLDDCFVNYSFLDIVTKIMKEQKTPPKRGDFISLNIKGWGSYFWDGERSIPPGEPTFCIPAEFKIPREFPIDYWDDCRIIFGYSQSGDFCYDTSEIKHPIRKEEIHDVLIEVGIYSGIAGIVSDYLDFSLKEVYNDPPFSIFKDFLTDFHIVMEYNKKEKEKSFGRFLETGRCFKLFYEIPYGKAFGYEYEASEAKAQATEEMYYSIDKMHDYIIQNGDFLKCVYVNEYKNRMKVEE